MARSRKMWIVVSLALGFSVSTCNAQSKSDPLKSGFENPPASARPQVYWHWLNGNVTKEGIKLDLEWMHRIGLGGFQLAEGDLSLPQVVPHPVSYGSTEWKDALKYATTLGRQLGLEPGIPGSPGWSESGGPWVAPSEGMKKYVWSETLVEGGRPFKGELVHPPSTTGPFQNLSIHRSQPIPQFYADTAVIAYRKAETDMPIESLHVKVTASAASVDVGILNDGDLEKTTKLPIPISGEDAWIQYEFPQPQTIRSITFSTKDPGTWSAYLLAGITAPQKALEVSDDGQHFQTVTKLSAGSGPEYTISFPAVTAKYFRITFTRTLPSPVPSWAARVDLAVLGAKMGPRPTEYEIAELVLHPGARVNRFEEKAAFTPKPDLYNFATPEFSHEDVIQKSDVIDLTSKMQPDGTLDWTPPPGHWIVLRFGYSLLGVTNHPASAKATGLEVDKLDRSAVKKYLETYLEIYKDAVGVDRIGRQGIGYVGNDSWEVGSQNWTGNMVEKFRELRGYDPRPWMPVLTGQIIESSQASDRFLWDFRRTISDLIVHEHYGQFAATLHEHGMQHYAESHESGRGFVADGMEAKKFTDVPQGAMWTQRLGVNDEMLPYITDLRESASAAHIYGQNLAAAESMTAAAASWAWSPATLKPTVDQEFANGINRVVIHESTHQPLIGKEPGLSLGPFGQWFNRNETWAEQAGPWIDYISRCSYLLQQGRFGADLVYFYGEDTNLTAVFGEKAPAIPPGYGFDYVNADGLIHRLSVSKGTITTPDGQSYRLLGLAPNSQHMSLPVLRAIYKLVQDGAVVTGPKPLDDPSLADDQAEFRKLNEELFGSGTGTHWVGKGTVYVGPDLADVFKTLHMPPDFDYSTSTTATQLLFVHRKIVDGDIYFVDNRSDRDHQIDAMFHVTGKSAELWHADTGKTEAVSFRIEGEHTIVPLKLEPWGTVFVVFRSPASSPERTLPEETVVGRAEIEGPWKIEFQPNRGAPSSISMERLSSWAENKDPGVKYFSGTVTYTKEFTAKPDWFKGHTRLWIDLGDVKNLAEVSINGKSLGVIWHAPYRVDVTAALLPGTNALTVKVTNGWVNRIIGDQQPNALTKYTFTTRNPYHAESPLLPSGLLGPISIYSAITGESQQ